MKIKIQSRSSLRLVSFCLIWLFVFLGFTSCQFGAKKDAVVDPIPKGYERPTITKLTQIGQNDSAVFSPDSKMIAFVSRNRSSHRNPQLYVLDLNSKQERRVTYQDGEVFDVAFGATPNRLYYSSSTDEIKENFRFMQSPTEAKDARGRVLPMTEIYSRSIDSHDIERLTNRAGFDGQVGNSNQNKTVTYSAYNETTKKLEIFSFLPNSRSRRLTKSPLHEEHASFSSNGKNLVWVRLSEDRKSSELVLSDGKTMQERILVADSFLNLDPQWHPNNDEVVFSSNHLNPSRFQIFMIRKDGTCLRQLTYDEGSHFNPQISPTGELILYTHELEGQAHISISNLAPPPCP